MMKIIHHVDEACRYISEGKIIAYPTEAVYGLGCDPFNAQAVRQLLAIKQRDENKGLILVINRWSQLSSMIADVPDQVLEKVRSTWPGPVTWVFPKSTLIPAWISGNHPTIAIRMSAHPIVQQLCHAGPLVSTSANRSGHEPALNEQDLRIQFPKEIDALMQGALGGALRPSKIFDVLSGKQIR